MIYNAFKPDRSHHCSVCDKCILNMNYHFVWVNNCIGFYNRKFFIQLLLFALILSIYIDITEGYFIIGMCLKLFKQSTNYAEITSKVLPIICYIVILILTFIIMNCTIFHFKLVLNR